MCLFNMKNKIAADRKHKSRLVFAHFFEKQLHYKVNSYPLTQNNRFITLGT